MEEINAVAPVVGYFYTLLYLCLGAVLCYIAIKINDKDSNDKNHEENRD